MHTRDDFIGAVKIKDGLFMGDEYAAGDFELLANNKITHVINCAGRELINHWESMGIAYLTLTWQETDYQVLFEGKFDVVTHLYRFIENALNKGESVLVHSSKGQNRSCCAVAVYCMKKYRWTLYKTLEFLQSRRPKMTIRPNFFSQLVNLENKFTRMGQGAKTFNWSEVGENTNIESEELLVTNTFLNSKPAPQADFNNLPLKEYKPNKLMWTDQQTSPSGPKPTLTVILGPKGKGKNEQTEPPKHIQEIDGKPHVKSILKGSDKVFCLIPEERPKTVERKQRKFSAGGNREAPGVNIHGRKGVTKLRPGSATAPNIKALMTKSSSSPMFEKANPDVKIPKIEGNIIHITVNNFISTGDRPGSSKGVNNKGQTPPYSDKKAVVSANTSQLDMNPIITRPASLHNSMTYERNTNDPRTLFQKEDNALSLSLNSKVNDFAQDVPGSSLGIFGTRTVKYDSLGANDQPKVRKINQPMKAFKLDETRFASTGKSTAVYDPSTGMIKYVSAGKTPMREDDPTKNFHSEGRKDAFRPVTAPSRATKKRQDSPYTQQQDAFYASNDQFRDSKYNSQNNSRSGSLKPRKDSTKLIITKNRFKSTSALSAPIEASYIPSVPKTKIQL